jgi:peptide-methionine (R)-S-oxide reductase
MEPIAREECQLKITNYELRITNYELRITNYELRVTSLPAGRLPIMNKDELKKKLTPEEFRVTQEKGTEQAFHNAYWDNHESGMYECKVCGVPLFPSDAKFDSGTGWPSFDEAVTPNAVKTVLDTSHGMERQEVVCGNYGAHLGHLFNDVEGGGLMCADGKPAQARFCTNSASLAFKKKGE